MNVLPRASTAMEWNKRTYDDNMPMNAPLPKRPRYSYHVRLESESSITSEGEESILTVQDQETEEVRDTSDTESKSEYDVIEYEVASLSESDDQFADDLSTSIGCSNDEIPIEVIGDVDVVVAVLGDTSLEAWAYDSNQTSSDEKDDSGTDAKAEFKTCVQCNRQNDVPQFRLCTNCFKQHRCWCCKMTKDVSCFPLCSLCYKVRKRFYPPRPRRARKQRTPKLVASFPASSSSQSTATTSSVNIEELKSCLDGMSQSSGDFGPSSQDSGLGSSQELPLLQLDKIVIPDAAIEETRKRRQSQDSDEYFAGKSAKLDSVPEIKDNMCMMCNEQTKNSAFLHGNSAHSCCCYKCAIQCWKTQKKCPVCNRKVRNVIRLFMS